MSVWQITVISEYKIRRTLSVYSGHHFQKSSADAEGPRDAPQIRKIAHFPKFKQVMWPQSRPLGGYHVIPRLILHTANLHLHLHLSSSCPLAHKASTRPTSVQDLKSLGDYVVVCTAVGRQRPLQPVAIAICDGRRRMWQAAPGALQGQSGHRQTTDRWRCTDRHTARQTGDDHRTTATLHTIHLISSHFIVTVNWTELDRAASRRLGDWEGLNPPIAYMNTCGVCAKPMRSFWVSTLPPKYIQLLASCSTGLSKWFVIVYFRYLQGMTLASNMVWMNPKCAKQVAQA